MLVVTLAVIHYGTLNEMNCFILFYVVKHFGYLTVVVKCYRNKCWL